MSLVYTQTATFPSRSSPRWAWAYPVSLTPFSLGSCRAPAQAGLWEMCRWPLLTLWPRPLGHHPLVHSNRDLPNEGSLGWPVQAMRGQTTLGCGRRWVAVTWPGTPPPTFHQNAAEKGTLPAAWAKAFQSLSFLSFPVGESLPFTQGFSETSYEPGALCSSPGVILATRGEGWRGGPFPEGLWPWRGGEVCIRRSGSRHPPCSRSLWLSFGARTPSLPPRGPAWASRPGVATEQVWRLQERGFLWGT